jgi:hypothetical protein
MTVDAVLTFWQASIRKEETLKNPRVPKHSRSINIGTLPSHKFIYIYI